MVMQINLARARKTMARPPRSTDGLFECWELERLWSLTETGISRAREQVFKRFAMCLLADPERTWNEVNGLIHEARADMAANVARYDRTEQRAFERELPERIARLQGGRSVIGEC